MKKIIAVISVFFLAACEQKQGQDVYKANELGVSRAVEYGTIIDVREVEIAAEKGPSTLIGAGVGGGSGSYVGGGSGQTWATVGGAVAGAIIGSAIENELGKSKGYEYTIEMRDGDIKTIVLPEREGDRVFKSGDKVRMESCDTGDHYRKCYAEQKNRQYQRLQLVSKFPSVTKNKTKKKKVIEVEVDNVDPNNVDIKGQ